MEFTPAGRRWSSPPLALQFMGLLLGGLVIAQLVTCLLTLLLPPEPMRQYDLQDIARALSGEAVDISRALQRTTQADPPEPAGPGWLTSEKSRHELALLLGRSDAAVQLWFFTPLPFAGTVGLPRESGLDDRFGIRPALLSSASGGLVRADYLVAQAGPPRPPADSHLPNGRMTFPLASPQLPAPPPPSPIDPTSDGRARDAFGDNGGGPDTILRVPSGAGPNGSSPTLPRDPIGGANDPIPNLQQPRLIAPGGAALDLRSGSPSGGNGGVPDGPQTATSDPRPAAGAGASRPGASRVRNTGAATVSAPSIEAIPDATPKSSTDAVKRAGRLSKSAPIVASAAPRGLFGFAPAPFVEGDFVAAARRDGEWTVVQPVPEPFPNSWQRRVLLWFVIAFALIAPLGWMFSRRVVRPLTGFAAAAEQLGRDPTAPVMALGGPAEIGRAAHAFNRMQSRLRSFVDDRTAMIGAISHDLRTPLTRMRFRIEDVEESLREGMLHEVDEMENMINSVLTFIREASEPGTREKLDLSTIVEDVVEDALFVGNDVELTLNERAPVEVDAIGMRRLFANLVENAVKYGDHARVRLFTDRQDAVTEVSDDGPGLPDDELERVFQPFYRASSARSSDKQGSGLGLAVCRSIARAHGGDVSLMRGERGLIAQVRLPLAYGAR